MSLTDVKVAVARVEEKLDGIAQLLNQRAEQWNNENAARDDRLKSHDKRLRKVETRQHWYSGAAAVAGAIFAVVGKTFFHA